MNATFWLWTTGGIVPCKWTWLEKGSVSSLLNQVDKFVTYSKQSSSATCGMCKSQPAHSYTQHQWFWWRQCPCWHEGQRGDLTSPTTTSERHSAASLTPLPPCGLGFSVCVQGTGVKGLLGWDMGSRSSVGCQISQIIEIRLSNFGHQETTDNCNCKTGTHQKHWRAATRYGGWVCFYDICSGRQEEAAVWKLGWPPSCNLRGEGTSWANELIRDRGFLLACWGWVPMSNVERIPRCSKSVAERLADNFNGVYAIHRHCRPDWHLSDGTLPFWHEGATALRPKHHVEMVLSHQLFTGEWYCLYWWEDDILQSLRLSLSPRALLFSVFQ